jgi:hypothetical protein
VLISRQIWTQTHRNLGEILAKNQRGEECASFIMAYAKALDCKLRDAPILIREINKKIGEYKLTYFKVSASTLDIEPFEVQLYSAKPLPTNRGTPVCPRCGCEARDLSDHMMRRHRNITAKPRQRNSRKIETKHKTHIQPSFLQNRNADGLIQCHMCNSSVRSTNLKKHLREVHHQRR